MTAHDITNLTKLVNEETSRRIEDALRRMEIRVDEPERVYDTAIIIEHSEPKPRRSSGGGGFEVRGTQELYKVVMLRAYLLDDDSLVSVGTAYDSSSMYLYPTWDYPRMR